MKIRDENGIICEDKVISKLLKLLGLYDDREEWSLEPERVYVTTLYDPLSGKTFISSKEVIEKAVRKINQELQEG